MKYGLMENLKKDWGGIGGLRDVLVHVVHETWQLGAGDLPPGGGV